MLTGWTERKKSGPRSLSRDHQSGPRSLGRDHRGPRSHVSLQYTMMTYFDCVVYHVFSQCVLGLQRYI